MTAAAIPPRPPALVIVGMHRSGTSLAASLMQAAGLDIGEQLMGARPGNEAGHFEDLEFHRWHERVLAANGLGAEGFVAGGRIAVPDELRREAERLVRERREAGQAWGWKNPRTTLLLGFWRELIPEAVFLGVVRPPWEVVDSLFRRGDPIFRTNPPFALEVWRHYNEQLLEFARRYPDRTLVRELEQVAEQPADLGGILRDRFELPLAEPPPRYRSELLGADVPTVLATAVRRSAPAVHRLYDDLRQLAGQEPVPEDSAARSVPLLDAMLTVWCRLRSAEAATATAETATAEAAHFNAGLARQLEEARIAIDEAVSRKEGARLELERQLAEAAEREAGATAERDRLAAQSDRLRAELATAQQQVHDLEQQLAASAAQRTASEARHQEVAASHNALVEDLQARLSASGRMEETLRDELASHDEQLAVLRREQAALRGELAGQRDVAARLRTELAAGTAAAESQARELATAEATNDVLRDDVERLEAACRENIRSRRQLDEELVRMARSNSWRLTGPLRSLRRRIAAIPAGTVDRVSRLGRRTWRKLPLGVGRKQRLRDFLFTQAAWAFRWTRSYREWRAVRDALARANTNTPPLAAAVGPPRFSAPGEPAAPPPAAPSPENDAWWGEGFTEWTNVRRGRPFYPGHEQPQVPHPDIGSYDLLEPGVLERQAAMARRYGIHGFCFYHYWFDGRRLLEQPLERLLASGRPDFPFCLCWANENWTRAWDGLDREVLVAQRHSPESDTRFIHDLLPYLRDRRYIRVEGRPLVAVYRAALLPDPAATADRWRQICRSEGLGEIHLVSVRSFDKRDPREFGFDAAIQFPPLLIPARDRAADPAVGAEPGFRGSLFDYADAVRFSLAEVAEGAAMYRGVMPAWDNTPRRLERGTAWMHASPERYGEWLKGAIDLAGREQPPGRRLVFINAWNEWAEGAHLEPDVQHGYRNLEETAAALGIDPGVREPDPPAEDSGVLVISHDAHLAGAQMVTLRTVQQWRRAGVPNVRIVCVGGGVLRPAFAAAYPTVVLEDFPTEAARREAVRAAADFGGRPPAIVYSSTVVNGPLLEQIRDLGMPIVSHAHELQKSIERWAAGEIMAATVRASDLFMAAAPAIRDNLVARHGIPAEQVAVVPAHIDCDQEPPGAAEREAVRHEWHAGPDDVVVFGCGTTDWRKGPDLFCEIAALAGEQVPGLRFAWAGGDADYHRDWLAERGLSRRVHFLGTRGDVRKLLHAADIFLLSSREDPMPLVALEAAATGLPVVCFAGAGDIPGFVGDDAGVVVPMEDVPAATEAILSLARDADQRRRLGTTGCQRVRATYDSRIVAAETIRLLREVAAGRRSWEDSRVPPLVSVIVPNYEHAAYLPERLESILAQGIDEIEIILLDDRSSDESLAILEAFARREPRAVLVANETNSGSAFRQWQKGLGLARGRYVWIAESDDSARPGLLPTLVDVLERHPHAVLAYCQSEMIDDRGTSLGLPLEWTADISPDRWQQEYVAAGRDEIATALIHKNTIPNVSAVVFRNTPDLADVLDDRMRLCGDWLAYVRLCERGAIAFSPRPLNLWRQRTSNSRTRPPGEVEWEEGRRVIDEAARILGLTPAATAERREAFRRRCQGWLAAALSREAS